MLEGSWVKSSRGALLFRSRHSIGNEHGAVAVARDIRASTARRLTRIEALQAHPDTTAGESWLRVEHRLSELYARSYLGIWHAIAHANSLRNGAAPRILGQMLRRPTSRRRKRGFSRGSSGFRLHGRLRHRAEALDRLQSGHAT